MDENHQDKAESKPTATKDKLSPPPLSTKDHRGPHRPQNNRMGAIIKSLGFFGYDKETKEYTSDGQLTKITKEHQPGKTFWDWLQLAGVLLIPLVIFLATMRFNQQQTDLANQQHQADQQQALDQQQAVILQSYIDNIQDLLLHDNLRISKPGDDVAILARSRTLTAIRGLDSNRKGLLVQFLYEAHLIGFVHRTLKPQPPIITLNGAFLYGANLQFTYLRGVNLNGAILQEADLDHADLAYANLGCVFLGVPIASGGIAQCVLLNDANLTATNLSHANLGGAIWTHTKLNYTDFSSANLSEAYNLTQQQLDQVRTCKSAILPKGLTCHRTPSP